LRSEPSSALGQTEQAAARREKWPSW
jgi:hypothetical protein